MGNVIYYVRLAPFVTNQSIVFWFDLAIGKHNMEFWYDLDVDAAVVSAAIVVSHNVGGVAIAVNWQAYQPNTGTVYTFVERDSQELHKPVLHTKPDSTLLWSPAWGFDQLTCIGTIYSNAMYRDKRCINKL